ncbi:hypothetical protein [Streptococcus oralis]|uniref:hypothetical protein n=1 Tax=Streptococcus oralis TaxID=1303 RepID=UPI0001CC58A1|nr:hypothetical protein [Streptococcus oralis]EFE56075.1 hypothetical protein HMPREF8579_1779 [Streptococcus oralis ATCC 35037]EFO03131.1 hypothetical protein SMSK23_0193 [Streptococcus oralis ATCC 35037]KZX02645.1 hypothetical protein A4222_07585 [Streptococcus oralis]OOR78118.1 hypothetical protein B0176_04760 [Streptococcus oralis]QQB71432.1 hypothetical protein I6H77_06435 [Streptococcus oralis]
MKHKIGELYLHTPCDFQNLTMNSDYTKYTLQNLKNDSCKIPEEYFFMKDDMGNSFENISNELITYYLPDFSKFNISSKNTYQDIESEPYYKYLTDREIKNSVINDAEAMKLEKEFILSMPMSEFESTLKIPYFDNFILAEEDFVFEFVKDYLPKDYKEEILRVLDDLNDFCYGNKLDSFIGNRKGLIDNLNSSVGNCSSMGSGETKRKYKIGKHYYIMHFKLFRPDSSARIYFNFDETEKKIVLGKIGHHL